MTMLCPGRTLGYAKYPKPDFGALVGTGADFFQYVCVDNLGMTQPSFLEVQAEILASFKALMPTLISFNPKESILHE